eukprot:g22133.t1
MLIGIVFGSYYAIQSRAGDPVTLWTQVRKAVQTAAETRNFMSLWSLIVALEDDDAWSNPILNAEYLVRKTVEYIKVNLDQPVLDLPDAVKMIGNSFNIMQKNEEILEQSVITPQQADKNPVGILHTPVEAETSDNPLDVLEKGISNLTDLLSELQQSHEPWTRCQSRT